MDDGEQSGQVLLRVNVAVAGLPPKGTKVWVSRTAWVERILANGIVTDVTEAPVLTDPTVAPDVPEAEATAAPRPKASRRHRG